MKNTTDILEILTRNLSNERLDSIIQDDISYQNILERLDAVSKKLEEYYKKTQDTELKDIINSYDTISHEESALHIKLAYQQGMRDIVQFALSLI